RQTPQVSVRLNAGERLEKVRDLAGVESAQWAAADTVELADVGERGGHRMDGIDLGVAPCRHDQKSKLALSCGPQDVTEQKARRLGRPLQIVEDEHHSLIRGCFQP